jgi:hypothetical protein
MAEPRRWRLRWLLVLLVVAALHLLLLVLLQRTLQLPPARTAPAQAPLVLVWVKPQQPTPPPTSPPAPSPAPLKAAAPQRPVPTPTPALRPAQPAITAEPAGTQVAAPASAASTATAAAATAASAPAGGLLDTEATRRVIREAARQRSIGEQGALATGEKGPVSEPDKMGQEIARGARGDCLKGEYAGSGMGLLSLPFWLMAELREKCRR